MITLFFLPELIPGIGKTYMKIMLEEREKKKFESYADLQERVGLGRTNM